MKESPLQEAADSQTSPVPQAHAPATWRSPADSPRLRLFRVSDPRGALAGRSEPSPEWMRAYRAGMLGLMPEDRDAVLRFEFQGDSVRFPA